MAHPPVRRPTYRCPACGTILPNNQYRVGKPWTCPSCSRQYRVVPWYELLIWVIAFVLSLAICFLAGLRGWKLAGGTIALLLPVDLACVYLIESLMQPPLENFPSNEAVVKNSKSNVPPGN